MPKSRLANFNDQARVCFENLELHLYANNNAMVPFKKTQGLISPTYSRGFFAWLFCQCFFDQKFFMLFVVNAIWQTANKIGKF